MLPASSTDQVAVSAGAATRVAPTLTTEGIDLVNINRYCITVSADSGQNLTGTGSMLAWRYSNKLNRWCRNPDLDFPITPTGATWVNMRDRASAEFDTRSFGRMLWAPSGVTVDGGSLVTTTIEATKEA